MDNEDQVARDPAMEGEFGLQTDWACKIGLQL